jgi:prepilin-type N-terminal cleavage/methylation domain-containing protein
MKKQDGVTLVEVLAVLVILTVLAGFTAPMVEQWKAKIALRAEVSKLVGELHRARCAAVRSNACVVFSYTENGYKTFIDDGFGGGLKEDLIQQPGERTLADVSLGKELKVVLSDSTFTLQRTGFTGRPGVKAGSVVLLASDGSKTKVVVNSIGRVRVEKL